MGREVRRVPKGWEHPKRDGNYIPLMRGPFAERLEEWDREAAKWDEGLVSDYKDGWKPKRPDQNYPYSEYAGERPKQDEYMPEFSAGTATMLMMYEDTSEGTPISPAFETPEELARWLTDNNASAFASMTATYEQWLAMCKRGWAPSMIMAGGHIMSGVEAETELQR